MIDEQLREKLITVAGYGVNHNEFEIVDEDDWTVDYKYERKETIVKHEDKYYCVQQRRSGSYFSDYHYDDPEVYEVKPIEKTITEWMTV